MVSTILLLVGLILGVVIAGGTFALNSSSPDPPGPVPFFGGAALALVCLIALIARLATQL